MNRIEILLVLCYAYAYLNYLKENEKGCTKVKPHAYGELELPPTTTATVDD